MYLRLWTKKHDKVRILQEELNKLYPQDFPKLKIDGKYGPKTQAKVMKFQKSTKKLLVDGVFGPKTLAEYKKKVSGTKLIGTHVTLPDVVIDVTKNSYKFQNEMIDVFKKENKQKELERFNNLMEEGMKKHAFFKTIVTGIRTSENAAMFARMFLTLRSWGFSQKQILTVFKQLSKLRGARFIGTLKTLSEPTGRFGIIFKSLGNVATKAILLCDFIECLYHASKGNYAAIFGIIYKAGMRTVYWRLGALNCLQTFLKGILPSSMNPKVTAAFKILRMCDPIGLGQVGIESLAASATAAYHWWDKGDAGAAIPRLDKLVKRIKKSPAGVLAELGDNAGKSAYEISRISSREWAHIMRLNWRRFKSIFSFNYN